MKSLIDVGGRCHCGAVEFSAHTDQDIALECNCSICQMGGFIHVIVRAENFSLIAGGEYLTKYRFHTGIAEHTFCNHCGVKPFYKPRSHPQGYSINWRCLPSETRRLFTIKAFDGQNWDENIEHIR